PTSSTFSLEVRQSLAAPVPRPPQPIRAMRSVFGARRAIDGAWGGSARAAVAAAVVSTNSRRVTSRECVGVMMGSLGDRYDAAALQLVGLLRELVRERARHAAGVALVDDVPRDEPRQEVGVDATCQVVARRDGAECPRVVVKARRLVDPGGLRGALAEPPHALERV